MPLVDIQATPLLFGLQIYLFSILSNGEDESSLRYEQQEYAIGHASLVAFFRHSFVVGGFKPHDNSNREFYPWCVTPSRIQTETMGHLFYPTVR